MAAAQAAKPLVTTTMTMPNAWIPIPATIRGFRPTRSDHAPVAIWLRPQVAG